MRIFFVEVGKFRAINVEHGSDAPAVIANRYHDLAPAQRAARDVAGEFVNVRHNEDLLLGPSRSAYSFAMAYPAACHRSLEGTQHKFRTHHTIEAHPMPAESLVQRGAHVRHRGDHVPFIPQQLAQLGSKSAV